MIPPLVTFNSYEEFEAAVIAFYEGLPKHAHTARLDEVIEGARSLVRSGFPPASNPTLLAILLGISPRLVSSMALRPKRYWRTFELPKRTGGTRQITAPRVFLKTIQLYLLQNALSQVEISEFAYGFSAGRGIFANASRHVGKRYVWNSDIKDFFPSITHAHVRRVFKSIGYDVNMSTVLASLCTFNGTLPQGAPTSPALSNIIFRTTDLRLAAVAEEFGQTYSRYADDLTFSSNEIPPAAFLQSIEEALRASGFRQNLDKVRLHGPGEARYVTGLVVNEKVNPNRQTRRRLRAVFHQLETRGLPPGANINSLLGWAAYVNAYDGVRGLRYLTSAKAIATSSLGSKQE